MGHEIWAVLETYQSKWVAVDREGRVLDVDADLARLRTRAPRAQTYVFACGEDVRS